MGTHKLIIVRHAEAGRSRLGDQFRELTERGAQQARMMGGQLREELTGPLTVLLSPAKRATQTWATLAAAAGFPPSKMHENVELSDEFYMSMGDDILLRLRTQTPVTETVVFVGHDPTVTMMACSLAAEGAGVPYGMPTGSAVVFKSPLPWEQWTDRSVTDARFILGVPAR